MDRRAGEVGFCGQTSEMKIGWAGLHFGEEPPISGRRGSGTVFFTGCTLGCAFCQNYQLSRDSVGRTVTPADFEQIVRRLHGAGAENLSLVTATQFVPGILETLRDPDVRSLSGPVVWNCSGFERTETVADLNAFVDIYLPDLKTLDGDLSHELFGVRRYPEIAEQAVRAMVEAKPLQFSGELLTQGVIVRHLVVPGAVECTRDVLRWFSSYVSGRALLSLMFQYTPVPQLRRWVPAGRERSLSRQISEEEYEHVLGLLEEYSIEDGYVQDREPDSNWLPDFTKPNPFPAGTARGIWPHDGP